MRGRLSVIFVVMSAISSLGAGYRTPNFVVEAPSPAIAQQVGQYAEHYRKEKALQWLGQEMPQWAKPCPLRVTITMNGSGGATSFVFDNGRILGMDMHIEGTLDRLLASVLPHEVTHTVFAHYFRRPVPRWADEGGSVLSEDDQERQRHDQLTRQILNSGRAIPLRRLFAMMQYPPDVMVLYAEGYSVTNFLVGQSNRPAFLAFVATGMQQGWDNAVRSHYNYNSVEELEAAWLEHLRNTKRQPAQPILASNGPATGEAMNRVVVRQTAPPIQPVSQEARPIYRSAMPADDSEGSAPGNPAAALPAPPSTNGPVVIAPGQQPGPVQFGVPQFESAPVRLGSPVYPER